MSDTHDALLIQALSRLEKNQEDMLTIARSTETRQVKLEERISPLFDNGQPGILTQLRTDVDTLKSTRDRSRGFLAGVLAVQSVVVAVAAWLLHRVGLIH